jgi:hypothetical protein
MALTSQQPAAAFTADLATCRPFVGSASRRFRTNLLSSSPFG